ncbi:MAG: GNAT family N-acetyltransferase [Anaerolineales bacterium]|nr:GNAT family N-acetyltransferase [Anaerolineales bacterium]
MSAIAPGPSEPAAELGPADLAAAVEANVFAMLTAAARALGGEVEAGPRLSRCHAWPGSPIFKGVWGARLAEADADEAIAETVAWFQARRAPFFFWWTGTETQPADLGARLTTRGLSVFEERAPAMAAEIDQLNWDQPRPADLRLASVDSEPDLRAWKQVFLEAFNIPEFAGQAWVDATLAIGLGRTPWQLLLGSVNGEPAGCGLLFCGAGVAGLVGLGTRPAFRRRGLGSAMQLERLRIARQLGYRYAVLFASEMGYSPYLKLGFRPTGRWVSRYLWRAG